MKTPPRDERRAVRQRSHADVGPRTRNIDSAESQERESHALAADFRPRCCTRNGTKIDSSQGRCFRTLACEPSMSPWAGGENENRAVGQPRLMQRGDNPANASIERQCRGAHSRPDCRGGLRDGGHVCTQLNLLRAEVQSKLFGQKCCRKLARRSPREEQERHGVFECIPDNAVYFRIAINIFWSVSRESNGCNHRCTVGAANLAARAE